MVTLSIKKNASIWAHVQSFVVTNLNLPILCMGDLNNILHANEKMGPNPANAKRISEFCYLVKSCGMFDLGYNGPAYTWPNKRFSIAPHYERLDRCLANAEWCAAFPFTSVHHLPMMKSDHTPILTILDPNLPKPKKPFRFENWWLLEKDFEDISKKSYSKSCQRPFHHKISYLFSDIRSWIKSKSNISSQLSNIEQWLLDIQSNPPSSKSILTKRAYFAAPKCPRQTRYLTVKDTKRIGLFLVTKILPFPPSYHQKSQEKHCYPSLESRWLLLYNTTTTVPNNQQYFTDIFTSNITTQHRSLTGC